LLSFTGPKGRKSQMVPRTKGGRPSLRAPFDFEINLPGTSPLDDLDDA
jgi:hypothetical protein